MADLSWPKSVFVKGLNVLALGGKMDSQKTKKLIVPVKDNWPFILFARI